MSTCEGVLSRYLNNQNIELQQRAESAAINHDTEKLWPLSNTTRG